MMFFMAVMVLKGDNGPEVSDGFDGEVRAFRVFAAGFKDLLFQFKVQLSARGIRVRFPGCHSLFDVV